MKQRLTALAAAAAILSASACGGHGSAGGSTPPLDPSFKPYTGPASLADFDWGKNQLQGAMLAGPAYVSHMQVSVMVKPQNAQGLVAYAEQASDPSSPLYRHFLTPQQIANQFGASQQDYQKAASYFAQNGLKVAGWPQRLALSVSGSQAAMERAFGTSFGVYVKDGQQFVAPAGTPHFSQAEPVAGVQNLVGIRRLHTYLITLPPRSGSGSNGYSPQQLREAFDFTGAYSKGYTGAGVTVGIIGTGPINVGNRSNLCDDKDLDALKSTFNTNAATVCEVDVTGIDVLAGLSAGPSPIPTAVPSTPNPLATPNPNGTPGTSLFPYANAFSTPPPVTSNCTQSLPACNPEDGEAQLDTQQVATLAPGATVDFYLAYNQDCTNVYFPNQCATPPPAPATPVPSGTYVQPLLGLPESDTEIEEAIAQNKADVISISYGIGEPQNVGAAYDANGVGYQTEEMAALAAEGVAVFVSSGDSGSAECLSGGAAGYLAEKCVSYPAGDPNVTSVGGVNAPINEFGQLTNNITAWGTTTQLGAAGSGGGVSTIFAAPSWQKSAIGATMRTQPDVAMIGDPNTGVAIYANSGLTGSSTVPSGLFPIGGTSVAAPEMAAMWAVVLDACKNTSVCGNGPSGHSYRLGNAAPYFYSIYAAKNLTGASGFSPHLPYAQVFYDVVYGSNAMVNPVSSTATPVPGEIAGPGYDQTTGVGVPFAGHLIQAITGQSVP
jgi:subtilase family serine protease